MTDNGIVETATCINIAMAKDRESFYCTNSVYTKNKAWTLLHVINHHTMAGFYSATLHVNYD